MRSSLPSLDAIGSSRKSGSAITHLRRSVKRTVSGSTSGCASASSAATSSASSQVSAISELLQAPVGQCLGQRAVHDAAGEGLGLLAERLDGVADGEVVLARTGLLERRDRGADPLPLAVREQPRLARQRLARRAPAAGARPLPRSRSSPRACAPSRPR